MKHLKIDLFASEYGWSIPYILDLPPDQKAELFHAMLYRKGLRTLKGAPQPEGQQGSLRERARAIFDTVA